MTLPGRHSHSGLISPLLLALSLLLASCAVPEDAVPEGMHGADSLPDAAPVDTSHDDEACPFEPGAEPQNKALFTDARKKPDLTIEDEFRQLVRAAVPGSTLRISIYSFSRLRVADEVIAAGQRGVDVRVLVDGLNRVESPVGSGNWVPNEAMRRIRAALGEDAVVICSDDEPKEKLKGGCLSSGINHNKYAVFSELCDGSKNVVFQSSANFSASQNDIYQNAVILRDDPGLHAGYLQYWKDEAAKITIKDYFRQVDGRDSRAWFFPRPRTSILSTKEPSTDVINGIFRNVRCSTPGTRVRVFMAFWNDSRDYLVTELARLRDEGCDVKILASKSLTTDGVKSRLESAFSSTELRFIPHIHSKYLFIDGGYLGAKRKLVWTGSHNWVYGSIRTNEEAILRVDAPGVFAAFDSDWEKVWAETSL